MEKLCEMQCNLPCLISFLQNLVSVSIEEEGVQRSWLLRTQFGVSTGVYVGGWGLSTRRNLREGGFDRGFIEDVILRNA